MQRPYHQNDERLRAYSSVFSRKSLLPIVNNGNYEFIDALIRLYDVDNVGESINTYLDYVKYIYKELSKRYCCEYIYKNILIEKILSLYRYNDSVILNEFRVGGSVADIVMFNGTSKAFEIKTELDSDKRFCGQMSDYSKIFKESYIVTHESLIDKYARQNESIGLITMTMNKGKLQLEEKRKAVENKSIDVDILMGSIRTNEYKNIVKSFIGSLPDVNDFDMFNACKTIIKQMDTDVLHRLFLNEMKKRKSNTGSLRSYAKELRQFCLSTHFDTKQYEHLYKCLNNQININ